MYQKNSILKIKSFIVVDIGTISSEKNVKFFPESSKKKKES
jgi:hypothetical protein